MTSEESGMGWARLELGGSRVGNAHVMTLKLFPQRRQQHPQGGLQGWGHAGAAAVSGCHSVHSSSWVVLQRSCPLCVPWRSSQWSR